VPGTSSLQTTTDPTRDEVAALERRVAELERELTAAKTELQKLQFRYLAELGPLYAELTTLDEQLAEAEIKAGLRVPDDIDEADDVDGAADPRGCGSANEPSGAEGHVQRHCAGCSSRCRTDARR
jgi:hypothetical protein